MFSVTIFFNVISSLVNSVKYLWDEDKATAEARRERDPTGSGHDMVASFLWNTAIWSWDLKHPFDGGIMCRCCSASAMLLVGLSGPNGRRTPRPSCSSLRSLFRSTLVASI